MISLILTLILIGVCLWLVETYVPMSPPIKTIIRVVVVFFLIIWLLKLFGVADVPVPRLR